MYKQLILLFYLFLTVPYTSFADLGLPDIQAVCKIELKNGTVVEGVILIAEGSYAQYCDTNGFYFLIGTETEKAELFNIDFYAIQPYKGILKHAPDHWGTWGQWFKNPNIYYLHDVTSKHYGYGKQMEIKTQTDIVDSSLIMLKRDIVHHINYELLKYIPIFPKVPEELFLSSEIKSIKPLHVNIDEIEEFELVWRPSQEWIDQISSVENALIEIYSDTDILLPVWLHQMTEEPERYKNLFKPWEF